MKKTTDMLRRIATMLVFSILVLPAISQEAEEQNTLTPQEQAYVAIAEGRNDAVELWFNGLSRSQQRQFDNLLIATINATNRYDLELAGSRLAQLEKLRVRDEELKSARIAASDHYDKVERMLSNVRGISVIDTLVGPFSMLMNRLSQLTNHLGEISGDAYITPDGLTKWQVSVDQEGAPAFAVIHKLGDGRWDQQNPEIVAIRGLPEGAKISYPYLLSDGNTLHFAVEQEGIIPEHTLGGKDVYVSRYDREAHALLVPTQMPMPFNSPADDFLYLIDEQSDLGWLLTSRGLPADSTRLYTFVPSSIKRYEGDGLDSIALLRNPVLVEGKRAVAPIVEREQTSDEVLFWIGSRAIRHEADLDTPQGKSAMRQYLTLVKALEDDRGALKILRTRIGENPTLQKDHQIRAQVLNLEQNIEGLQQRVKAIRNELIQAEGGL